MNDKLEPLYDLIKKFEGLYLSTYLCPAGVFTIGYGSTGPDITPGLTWTKEQAESRMKSDVEKFVLGTIESCPILGTTGYENALCAVADFAYNVGLGNLKSSTLKRVINAGDFEEAAKQLMRWNKAAGRVLPGLTRRRAAEASILLTIRDDMR